MPEADNVQLHLTLSQGQWDVLEDLLRLGVDTNRFTRNGTRQEQLRRVQRKLYASKWQDLGRQGRFCPHCSGSLAAP